MPINPLKDAELRHKAQHVDLCDFLVDHYFTAHSGRALIVQVEAGFSVFYLSPDLFESPDDFTQELESFRAILNGIASRYTIEESPKQGICVLQPSFNTVAIQGHRIQLNQAGAFTEDPEIIRDAAGNILYRGQIIEGQEHQQILKCCTGALLVPQHQTSTQVLKDLTAIVASQQDDRIVHHPPSDSNDSTTLDDSPPKRLDHITMLLLTLGLVAVVALIFSQQNRLKALEDQLSTVTHSAISISKGSPVINKDSTTLISKKGAPTATREQYYGIDVSHLQVDLLKFINKHDSLHFIFCKATEGISLKDDRYAENVKLTKGKKLLLGAYHFYRANDDPVKQANFFWETIQTQQLPVLPLAIDLEMKSFPGEKPAAYPNFQRDLSTLLRELTRLSGRQPILYTNYDFAQHHLTTKDLAEYPLWLADYNNKRSNPPTPDIWKQKGVVIWQKTDTYLLHHQNTDLDVYVGSLGKLLQL